MSEKPLLQSDTFLVWARHQREEWVRTIALLSAGKMTTTDRQTGANSTLETKSEMIGLLNKLDALIAKQERRND